MMHKLGMLLLAGCCVAQQHPYQHPDLPDLPTMPKHPAGDYAKYMKDTLEKRGKPFDYSKYVKSGEVPPNFGGKKQEPVKLPEELPKLPKDPAKMPAHPKAGGFDYKQYLGKDGKFDYSRFMGGKNAHAGKGPGGFDYAKFMGAQGGPGGFDYSQFMSGPGGKGGPDGAGKFDYTKYMKHNDEKPEKPVIPDRRATDFE